jgi:hypothetical protein
MKDFIIELISSVKIFDNFENACKYLKAVEPDFNRPIPKLIDVINNPCYNNYNIKN